MRVLKHIKCTLPCMDHYPHRHRYMCMYTLSSKHCHTLYPTVQISYCYGGQVPIQLLCLSHTQMLPATHTYVCWHWGILVSIRGLEGCDTPTCSVPGTGLGHAVILPRNCNYLAQRHKCVQWRTAAEVGSTTVHYNLRWYNVSHYISHCNQKSYDLKTRTRRQEEGRRTSLVTL